MGEKKFPDREAISFGWQTMKKNFGFFFIVLLIMAIFIYLPSIASDLTQKSRPFLSLLLNLLSTILSLLLGMGFIKICLKVHAGEEPGISDLFSCSDLFFKYFFSSLVYSLIVVAGLILLIVPGIIWGIKFQFFPYFIVDEDSGPIEALKKSAAITKGFKWNLFGFNIFLILITLLGILALIVGLFAAIPTQALAVAFMYRHLKKEKEALQGGAAPVLPS